MAVSAFTFNSTNVGSSGLSTVRFYIGETSSSLAIVEDGVITGVLTHITSDYLGASIAVAESMSAYYAKQADTRNEGLDVMASQRAKAFDRLATNLRRRFGIGAEMFVGGRSQDTKDTYKDDSDLVQPSFEREMDDFPGTISSSTSA